MDNNILKLKTENGNFIEIEVYDIINNEENNKDYIVYSIKGKEGAFISILNQNETSYSLDTIEDANEFKEIEDYLEQKLNKESGERKIWVSNLMIWL